RTRSGYAETLGGRRLIFSFLSNNQGGKNHEALDTLDALCVAMVEEFDRKPAAVQREARRRTNSTEKPGARRPLSPFLASRRRAKATPTTKKGAPSAAPLPRVAFPSAPVATMGSWLRFPAAQRERKAKLTASPRNFSPARPIPGLMKKSVSPPGKNASSSW